MPHLCVFPEQGGLDIGEHLTVGYKIGIENKTKHNLQCCLGNTDAAAGRTHLLAVVCTPCCVSAGQHTSPWALSQEVIFLALLPLHFTKEILIQIIHSFIRQQQMKTI